MKPLIERQRSIGLTSGSLWLIAVSAVAVIWSLLVIGTPWARIVLIVAAIIFIALVVMGIVVIRAVLHMPLDIHLPTSKKKNVLRRFIFVVVVEVLAFSIVNPVVANTGHFELLPSLDLIIVGIHFLPLAWIFRVPRYYITGLFFCVIPVLTLLLIPKEFVVGNVIAWYVVPSIGCGLTALLTSAAGLREAWKSVTESRTSAG